MLGPSISLSRLGGGLFAVKFDLTNWQCFEVVKPYFEALDHIVGYEAWLGLSSVSGLVMQVMGLVD